MKLFKYKILLVVIAMMVFQTSCDNDFATINSNPSVAADIDPNFQFTFAQLRTSGGRYENWRAGLIYSSMMIQHMAATCGYWTGDKYTYNAGYSSSLFDRAYTEQVKEIVDLVHRLGLGETGDQTMLGMARIWKVVIFHRLTDLYGDIPYSEAGRGAIDGIDFPVYDSQDAIYADMLNELEQAVGQIGSGGFGGADLIYGGDADKWKRFGNSLMLRLAMRMSEADPSAAQQWVGKAIAGGVMNSVADDAFIQHTNGPEGINKNGIGEVLDKSNGFGDDCPRLSTSFVDRMLATGDPRLNIVGIVASGGDHKGLPNGLDSETINDYSGGADLSTYSSINPLLVKVESPMYFMSYAETEFLLAEAAMRGWGASDADSHYNAGVSAAMKIYGNYDASLVIDDAAIEAYLAANPFDGTMEAIGTQYWFATLLNEYEAYANWRRTGFPTLTPVNYSGNVTNGTIPVRLAISQGEGSNNPNFEAAKSNQGLGSDFSSHMSVPVWWDK